MALTACDHPKQKDNNSEKSAAEQSAHAEKAEVLPYLNMQEAKADYALPFCEKKNCIDVDIQTIKTQDEWLNGWIAKNQANVIQQQIEQNKNLTLQQAVNAYVKKSDEWQDKYSKNKAYELHVSTRIASQRNQYVLLQVGVDAQQEDIAVKDSILEAFSFPFSIPNIVLSTILGRSRKKLEIKDIEILIA